jgi:integration host factor subunit alpha
MLRSFARTASMTITKAELAAILVEGVGLNQREAKEMVEQFFKEISDVLETGGTVKLAGFGVFSSRDKPERPGRNPKTGEETAISARRVVTWQPSGNLKSAVDSSPHLNLRDELAA